MGNVLNVFIASPSDLVEERKKASDVVTEINEAIKKIDWWIDLLGWEDTLPGVGRPQSLINQDVHRCDLFIGLLWRRWGTPPSRDGDFTSGFEEEFSIARARQEQAASPEIWMFFKAVETAQIADAGVQLQRVLSFRESLVAAKSVLFKEFSNLVSWETLLRKYLLRYVLQAAGPQGETAGARATINRRSYVPRPVDSAAPAKLAGQQIASIARLLSPAFATGDINSVANQLASQSDKEFYAVRSLLLSTALVEQSRTSQSAFPAHELNTLYRHREMLQATDAEIVILFRTVLADNSDVKPGWYWLTGESETIETRLLWTALFDTDNEARAKSIEILQHAQISLFERLDERAVRRFVQRMPTELRDLAWSYTVRIVRRDDLPLLRNLEEGTWLAGRLSWLEGWLTSAGDLNAFIGTKPDPQLIPDWMKDAIRQDLSRLTEENLRILEAMPLEGLRDAASVELRSRGLSSRPVVLNALSSLLRSARTETSSAGEFESDEARYVRLNVKVTKEIRTLANWFLPDGPTIYRILIERGELSRQLVRENVATGFQRVFEQSRTDLVAAVGKEDADQRVQEFEGFHDFIKFSYTQQTLLGLQAVPSPEDAAIARPFLKDQRLRGLALAILAATGDAADVPELIEIALSAYGEEQRAALEGVRRLVIVRVDAAKALLRSKQRDVRRAAFSMLQDESDDAVVPFLEELLGDENDDVRAFAVAQLYARVGGERLSDILRSYTQRASYFYNVVTWIDRLMYSPAPIVGYYKEMLSRSW